MAYVNNSVYWVGADGNVYLKTSSGVQNVGSASGSAGGGGNYNLGSGGFESNTLQQSVGATRIADPNAPAPSNPNGTPAPTTVDKSNDIAIQNAGLSAADQQQAGGLSAVDQALAGLTGQYDTEKTANEGNYGTQSDTNRNNLESNKESALLNAAQGRRGLFGTLASLGALNGSGIDLANHAVQQGANEDLTGAEGTFGSNQTGLDTAITKFRQDDERRRQDAQGAATNAKAKVQHDTAVNKQGFYTNLANDYAAEGDTANASKYTGLVASLYPDVSRTSLPDTTNLTAESAAFTPGTLANYLSGQGNTTVTATPTAGTGTGNNALPGLTAADANEKKKLAALTPVPA